jgi:hypothetical protein
VYVPCRDERLAVSKKHTIVLCRSAILFLHTSPLHCYLTTLKVTRYTNINAATFTFTRPRYVLSTQTLVFYHASVGCPATNMKCTSCWLFDMYMYHDAQFRAQGSGNVKLQVSTGQVMLKKIQDLWYDMFHVYVPLFWMSFLPPLSV